MYCILFILLVFVLVCVEMSSKTSPFSDFVILHSACVFITLVSYLFFPVPVVLGECLAVFLREAISFFMFHPTFGVWGKGGV